MKDGGSAPEEIEFIISLFYFDAALLIEAGLCL